MASKRRTTLAGAPLVAKYFLSTQEGYIPMHISHAALLLTFASMPLMAQTAAPARQDSSPQGTPAPANAAPAAVAPSTILRPPIQAVQATLESLKLDKWKKGTVRDEAGENVQAILRDIQTNFPPLVSAADAEPGSLSKSLPVMKHLDALYDVLLRVEEASRVSAPGEQVSQLQQVLKSLSDARLALDANLETQAASQEKQIADLRAAYQQEHAAAARAVATAETAKPCTPPAPAHKKRRTSTSKTQQSPPVNQKTQPATKTPQ